MATLFRKARSLSRKPPFVLLWLVPVWLLLGVAKAAISLATLKKLLATIGRQADPFPFRPVASPDQVRRALLIGRVVRLAAGYTPWESNCFPQAVVACLLLRLHRVPYALYFGVRRPDGQQDLEAHAWVVSGPVDVTGGASFGHFTVVSAFLSPLLKAC